MTEKQAWRPPLAPKPSITTLSIQSPPEKHPSPAIHGAASAFSPSSTKSPITPKPVSIPLTRTTSHQRTPSTPTTKGSNITPNASAGALLAAAAAQKARPTPVQRDGIGAKKAASPARGRSQLAIELEKAGGGVKKSAHQPRLSNTSSAIAARAASASPIRSTGVNLTGSVPSSEGLVQSKSPRDATLLRSREHSISESETPRVVNGSLPASLPNKSQSLIQGNGTKLDFERIPALSQLPPVPTKSSKQRPPEIKLSASQTTSRGAAPTRFNQMTVSESENQSSGSTSPIAFSPQESVTLSSVTSPLAQVSTAGSFLKDEGYFQRLTPTESKQSKYTASIPVSAPTHLRPSLRPPTLVKSPEARDMRKALTPSLLADAMVASSLASSRVPSRAPSPTKAKLKTKPPPPPLRRAHSAAPADMRRYEQEPTRKAKPLPIRPMRQTLRKHAPGESDDEDTKRGRKHWVRKHPNKHHEGDRKRWRDKVTERERKRYEGVWAANRGLLWDKEMTDTGSLRRRKGTTVEQDLVLNVVVRDIWERSRLPRDALEEIWDLVAVDESRFLNKEEFVVGLWLIDQRLKGRKLPYKVSPSVWSSVRHIAKLK